MLNIKDKVRAVFKKYGRKSTFIGEIFYIFPNGDVALTVLKIEKGYPLATHVAVPAKDVLEVL